MRVLHLTRDFPPHHRGGISTVVEGMVQASTDAGVLCAVVSFDGWRNVRQGEGAPTTQIHEVSRAEVMRVTGKEHLEAARGFSSAFSPEVIHVHHSMLWDFAEELREVTNAPIHQTIHVLQAEQNRLRGVEDRTLSLESQERSLHGAQFIHAPSESVAERLRHYYPQVTEKLRVTPFGISPSMSASGQAEIEAGFVLYVGRFADIKGTVELFETMLMVHRSAPETRWVIAGGIPENKKSERRWLKRWEAFAPPELKAQVHFSGWHDAEQLGVLYTTAAMVFCPSWYETFGMVALEAMSHGAALVAAEAGGVGELVEHGVTGYLSAPKDVHDFGAQIVELLQDPLSARRVGDAARQHVEESWLWPARISRVIGIYQELL